MNATDQPDAPVQSPGYETTDIHVGGILAFAGGLVVLALVLHAVLSKMFDYFVAREEQLKQQISPLAAEEPGQLPPEPRLEGLESAAGGAQPQKGYGWVDRKAGVVRIPIQNAMKILSNRLPSRPEQEDQPERAEPGGSSSGRTPRKGSP
jgi:hypothetical protein